MISKNVNKVALHLMRHGETIINKAGRMQGWCDGVLTKEGIEVAENTAIGLSGIEFKGVYSSDLGRAIKTAEIVLKRNKFGNKLEIKEILELREVYFGKYEAELENILISDILNYLKVKSFEEVIEMPAFSKVYADTCAALDETGAAEDHNTLINRVMKGVSTIIEEVEAKGGGNVLVVIHGGVLRNFLKNINPNLKIFRVENCSISLVEYSEGEFNVKSINDMSYKEKGEEIRFQQR